MTTSAVSSSLKFTKSLALSSLCLILTRLNTAEQETKNQGVWLFPGNTQKKTKLLLNLGFSDLEQEQLIQQSSNKNNLSNLLQGTFTIYNQVIMKGLT